MWKKQKGFTLIELLVTVIVLGIAAALALANFNTMIANYRASTLGDDLLYAFSYARSEAVKRSTRVSVCVSSDQVTCTGETDWRVGYIAFVDTAASDTAPAIALTGEADILRKWALPTNNRAQILVRRNGVDVSFVRFTGLGVLARNDNNAVDISSNVQGCTGTSARTIRINLAGQIRSEKTACP